MQSLNVLACADAVCLTFSMALFKIIGHALEVIITISICKVLLTLAGVIGVLKVLERPHPTSAIYLAILMSSP